MYERTFLKYRGSLKITKHIYLSTINCKCPIEVSVMMALSCVYTVDTGAGSPVWQLNIENLANVTENRIVHVFDFHEFKM